MTNTPDGLSADPIRTPRSAARVWMLIAMILTLVGIVVILAIQLRPSPENQLAQALILETSDPHQSLHLLDACINASGGNAPIAQVVRCRVLLHLRRSDEAFASFQRIARPTEAGSDNLLRLAHAAHVAGNLPFAQRVFEMAGPAVLSNPVVLREWIDVVYQQEDRTETIRLCREYAKLVPKESFPWLVSASIHHENNSGSLAIDDYREALRRKLPDAEAARVRFQLVSLLMERGDIPEARQHCDLLLKASVDANSNELVAIINAELLFREGNFEKSTEVVETLLKKNPNSLVALMIRGFLKFESGKFPEAIEDLRGVVQKDPYNQRAHYKLGQALQKTQQTEAAAIHFQRSEELVKLSSEIMVVSNLLANQPGDRSLRQKLAELNEQRGNVREAARWRKQVARP